MPPLSEIKDPEPDNSDEDDYGYGQDDLQRSSSSTSVYSTKTDQTIMDAGDDNTTRDGRLCIYSAKTKQKILDKIAKGECSQNTWISWMIYRLAGSFTPFHLSLSFLARPPSGLNKGHHHLKTDQCDSQYRFNNISGDWWHLEIFSSNPFHFFCQWLK